MTCLVTLFDRKPQVTKNLNGSFLAFTTNFFFQIDLSGNTVWPQASGIHKITKMAIFAIFD